MTATDPRPELAAMPAASRPKPPPARGGGRVGGRFRASGSGGRSPAKVRQRREALPQRQAGGERNGTPLDTPGLRHGANARGNARSAKNRKPPRATMTHHDIP